MSNDKDLKVTGLLGYKLKQTQHALRLHMDEALRDLNLTTPQYAVLAQLELRPGISSADLARSSFITAQTMHGIVSNLEKRNLVERKKDPNHGRILTICLTSEGLKILRQAHKIISEVEDIMASTISESKMLLFEQTLIECFNNLKSNK